ncbi:MAG: Uma2 family endonuclease [Candidatus Competibacter sp.]|nr:Uma2 family endonuclease [Candidatus Competibacter sp.]
MADPVLQDLPYKIELNEYGKIVMSPASNRHSLLQGDLIRLLGGQLPGRVFPECSIQTTKGVKVADVVWCSVDFIHRYNFTTPYPHAPELCVEIVSPSNSRQELAEKIMLYLAAGAREVWIVFEDGQIEIYDASGRLERSALLHPITLELSIL